MDVSNNEQYNGNAWNGQYKTITSLHLPYYKKQMSIQAHENTNRHIQGVIYFSKLTLYCKELYVQNLYIICFFNIRLNLQR